MSEQVPGPQPGADRWGVHQLGVPAPQPFAPVGPPPWAAVRPTNTKAILAICLLWVPVASIVLGVQARREIARTGEAGHGLATWGLALGITLSSFYVMYALFVLVYAVVLLVVVGGGAWAGLGAGGLR